jgi:hypothetical protein
MDGAKGLVTRALGFLGGAAVLTTITSGLASHNKWGRGAALLAKVVGIVGGGILGAWAAIKSFPNKAAHIEHNVEKKHERKELFDTLRDKELGAVSFTAMPAHKLVNSSAAMQDAYFAGMAKQTMDFTVNEKPLHTFFGVKTPFDGATSPFGAVAYDSSGGQHSGQGVDDQAAHDEALPEEAHH